MLSTLNDSETTMAHYILNIGFVIEPSRFDDVKTWLLDNSTQVSADPSVVKCELLEVAEVPGDPDFGKETRNVSMQLTFEDIDLLHQWIDINFGALAEAYSVQCGEPMIFMTVLKPL